MEIEYKKFERAKVKNPINWVFYLSTLPMGLIEQNGIIHTVDFNKNRTGVFIAIKRPMVA